MNVNKKIIVLSISILWLVLAIGLLSSRQIILKSGQRIILETVPVDPRDLLRGDYITLQYKIGTLDLTSIPSEKTHYNTRETVFVALHPMGSSWEAAGVSSKKAKLSTPDNLVIRGKVTYCYSRDHCDIDYGIENFFVPEGKGRPIEKMMRWRRDRQEEKTPVTVEVVVASDGTAMLNRLFVQGEEIKF